MTRGVDCVDVSSLTLRFGFRNDWRAYSDRAFWRKLL